MKGKKYYAVLSIRDLHPFLSEVAIAFRVSFSTLTKKISKQEKRLRLKIFSRKKNLANLKVY